VVLLNFFDYFMIRLKGISLAVMQVPLSIQVFMHFVKPGSGRPMPPPPSPPQFGRDHLSLLAAQRALRLCLVPVLGTKSSLYLTINTAAAQALRL
jgi:hypothetical protein